MVGVCQAQSINLETTYVRWTELDDQGDGLFGWADATASSDGFSSTDSDHFDDAMGISLGGVAYGGDISAAIVDGTRITLPTQSINGMNVHVEFWASNTSPVMRQIIVIENPTETAFSSNIQWINNTGNDSSQRNIGSSSNDLNHDTSDRWIATADTSDLNAPSSETNVWVMYGPNNPTSTTNMIAMAESYSSFGGAGDEGLTATLPVDVPAGQTRYLMFFVIATPTGQEGLDLAVNFDDTNSALFQSLVSDLSAQQLSLMLNWTEVGSFTFVGIAQSPKQLRIARVFDVAFNGSSTGNNLATWNALNALTDAQKLQVMDQAVPNLNMGATGALLGAQQMFMDMLSDRGVKQLKAQQTGRSFFDMNTMLAATDNAATGDAVNAMQQKPTRGLNLWVQSLSTFGDQDSDANAAGYSWQSYGGAFGVDKQIKDNYLFGIAMAGYNTDVEGALNSGHVDITTFNLAGYGGWSNGKTHVDAGMSVGFAENKTSQPYSLLGVTAEGKYDSLLFNTWVGIGHVLDLKTNCPVKVEPVAGLAYQHIRDEDHVQTGAGGMNQSISEQNTDSLISRLGVNFVYDLEMAANQQLEISAGTAWRHEFLDDQVHSQSSLSGSSFSAEGVDRGSDAWEVSGGIAWQLRSNMVLSGSYTGQFASNWDNHHVKFGLLIQF
ncbi:MAG: autotransporter outer membrane beta-barrel domain-containing protein [Phycisphaeraceae bacterium JB051]